METNIDRAATAANLVQRFIGNYDVTGSSGDYYQNQKGVLLKLCERKSTTPLKPLLYLMYRDQSSGKFAFLTSLYPDGNGTYTAEISKRYFTVSLNTHQLNVWRK
jgi:hypothetical protein